MDRLQSACKEGCGSAHAFWLVLCNGDAGMLRVGGSQPLVCLGIRCGMCAGISLWISSRGMAVRAGGGYLVSRRGAAVVAHKPISIISWKEMNDSFKMTRFAVLLAGK